MPPTKKPFGKAVRVKRLVAVFVTMLLAAGGISLVSGQAQRPAAPTPSGGEERVLVRTPSGRVVTSSGETLAPQAMDGLTSLLRKYPGTWKADVEQNFVKRLRPVTEVNVGASPDAFSAELMSESARLFGVPPDEVTHFADFPLRDKRVVEYRQTLDGIPVEHSFVTIAAVGPKLEQVSSRLYRNVRDGLPGTTPALSREQAGALAEAELRALSGRAEELKVSTEADLRIFPAGESFFLTWKVVATARDTLLSYTYYVDALTGQVVEKYSNVKSQEKQGAGPRNGETRQTVSATLTRKEGARPAAAAAEDADEKKPDAGVEPAAPSLHAAAAWENLLSENFDVRDFPYAPWRAFDNNGATGGDLYWDDQNCVSNDPSWSLWAADGGTNRLNACTDNYANNMDSWVTYGPFSLSNAADGLLDFHYRNDSEANFDHFRWMVSVDGTNFYGYQVSGGSGGWQYASLDFKNVPTLGNILGRPNVWIAFTFTSDSSVISGKGAFVDDVAIKRLTGTTCSGVSGHVGGHIYGRNLNELQLSNFKNMKVVLERSFAFDSNAVTDASGNYSSPECSDQVRFELEGYGARNFVKVRDCDGGGCPLGGDTLKSPDLGFASVVNFDWNEDADDKKEVNVFWHLNEMHDWFKNLAGQDLMNYQMQAHVDYVDNETCAVGTINAYYHSGNKNIFFCPSDVSKESDIIYHEYTHGIVDHIANYDLPYFDEGGAMDEGMADYFAAARNGDPTIGEGVGVIRRITDVVSYNNRCNRDTGFCGAGQYWTRSTAASDTNDYGWVHHNSLVPSGALWNLRQSQGLSASFVDELVIDTLMLQRPLTYQQLLDGLVAQDGGSHQTQIRAAFATRGVGQIINVGQGAPNPQLFIDAYNRNNLSAFVIIPPVNAVHRWDCSTCSPANPSGKGLIQDFDGNDGVSHHALMQHDGVNFVALIYGGMWTKFIALGGVGYDAANARMLGYPVADRNCSDYNAACFTDAQLVSPSGTSYHYQRFQGGALVLHKSGARINQTYEVHGAIRTRWQDLGGPGGSYGLPIIDEYAWQSKRRSDFEGGSICYNPSTNQTEPGCTTPPAQVSVTFQTSPSGRSYTVDGVTYTASQTLTWNSGSSHTVGTTSPQSGATGTRYAWGSWSDGGAISHTVAPTANATYTANFTTQHFLTTAAGSGGSVGPAGGWYNAGQAVTVTATPNSGFSFAGWTGSGSGSFTGATNPVNVTMNGPVTQTAGFTQNGIQVTVQTSPAGRSFTVDGGTYTAAQTFVWVAGSAHTIGTASPQSGAQGTRYVWAGWNDGGAITHTVSPGGNATYTASFTTQHLLTMNAGAGGGVSPAGNWYNVGQSVSISATPNSGFGFGGWTGSGTGSYTGSNNPATVSMNGPVTETAGFTASNPCGTDTVWAESGVPAGATAYPSSDGWNWVTTNPAPFSGSRSHQSALAAGFHDHYFAGATNALQVRTGDVLFAYVYLDPASPPGELMLAWNDGVWGYRAYWGANLINVGTDGTASRRYMGPLPAAGQWVRLEVPAALVGLEGHSLTGMSFIEFNGRATWGRVGRACSPVPTSRHDRVWVGDALPAGATPLGSGEGWNWVGADPSPYSGNFSHQSANVAGYHDHYFVNAADTLPVNAGDSLIAYVYLDPSSPPSEIMLSWNDGNWGYRAYWGANLINAGTDGTASRRYMGPLPAAGRWARLEVPAALVGLEGHTLRGMSFIQYNGRAAWDHAGKTSEQVWVDDAVPAGAAALASNDGWNWVTTNPVPYSGSSAHQSAALAGEHDHYFINATSKLPVGVGDVLFAYVYLDPANPPGELMLSWNDGVWGYRAYWGANLIQAGTDGTVSRRYMGPLPAAGQWARLEVPAALVGLEGHSLTGMSFLAYNGRVTWDRAGKMGGGRVNHALAANGAAASALSTTPDADFAPSTFPASGAINGNRKGDDWGRGGAWRGGTGVFPNWLEVSFQGQKTISEIDVFTTQDGLDNAAEPTSGMTFALYGLTDFQVQYWDGSAWQVVPGGVVSGNNKVWRQIQFAPVTASKVRVLCTAGLANAARIVEVEAWGN
jgi:hypothetical protein